MNQNHFQEHILFGPYRALLRALLLRRSTSVDSFLRQFSINPAIHTSADVYVHRSNLDHLWKIAASVSLQTPLLVCDAAQLFQFRDLGERGWLFQSAPDFERALFVLKNFFTALDFEVHELDDHIYFRWTPHEQKTPLMPVYFLAICLNSLLSQGLSASTVKRIILPAWTLPQNPQHLQLLQERFCATYSLMAEFSGLTAELHFEHSIKNLTFQTADESVFTFFIQRCRLQKSSSLANNTNQVQKKSELGQKIKGLMLSNLANAHYGATKIAADLGISHRTLERSLNKDKLSLRELRQSLQCETAIEMLNMGIRAKEVATRIGFSDVAAFSRAFRSWTGLNPSHLKRRENDT